MASKRTDARDNSPAQSLSYKAAGVSLERAEDSVAAARQAAAQTARTGLLEELGGFGALFDLQLAGWHDPVLVAATDGVGTKLLLGDELVHLGAPQRGQEIYAGLGIDLVAMCVNDLATRGAEALFFLDYIAAAHLEQTRTAALLAGIATGCKQAGAALLGGETAELPGIYDRRGYDLAGFAVGAVERDGLLPRQAAMQAGDKLFALPATGVHANGFSLVRAVLQRAWPDEQARAEALLRPAAFAESCSLGEALLTPTPILARELRQLAQTGKLKGAAHITGGGIAGNLVRILPHGLTALVESGAWQVPAVFAWLQETGEIDAQEIWRVFNCGLAVVLVGDESLEEVLPAEAFAVGRLVAGDSPSDKPQCRIVYAN